MLRAQRRTLWTLATIALLAASASLVAVRAIRKPRGLPPLKDTSWVHETYRNLAYAPLSPSEQLDLYLPNDGVAPYPVIVAIHGGAFLVGDKGDAQQNGAIEALRHGYAVASINYRMAREAPFPAAVQDTKAAIRFLRANAATYRLDPHRFIAWGDSAGGYLAVMAGVTGNTNAFDDPALGNPDQSSRVQAVIDWFGPIVFADIDGQFRQSGKGMPNHGAAGSPESRFLGQTLDQAPEALRARANPLSYLGPDLPPFLIQHGDRDALVPTQQSEELAAALKPRLPSASLELDILAGASHGDQAFETPENLDKVFGFLSGGLAADRAP